MKYRVIDPIFKKYRFYMQPLWLDSIKTYINRQGEEMRTYKLKYEEGDIFCMYFGEKQIEKLN